jgi:hypothetical protein
MTSSLQESISMWSKNPANNNTQFVISEATIKFMPDIGKYLLIKFLIDHKNIENEIWTEIHDLQTKTPQQTYKFKKPWGWSRQYAPVIILSLIPKKFLKPTKLKFY